MAKEKEPLHEWILRLVYLEYPEKPEPMSTEDILWKIDDPMVSLHNVKEVLDWLVRKNAMEVRFGKYQLDRIKFLELKEQNKHLIKETVPVVNYYNINNGKSKKNRKAKEKIILTTTVEDNHSRRAIDVPSDNYKKWLIPIIISSFFLLAFYALNQLEIVDNNENNITHFSLDNEEDFILNKNGIGNIASLKSDKEIDGQINQKIGLVNRQMDYLLKEINSKDQKIKEHTNIAFTHFDNELKIIKEENRKLWIALVSMFSFFMIFLIYVLLKNKK